MLDALPLALLSIIIACIAYNGFSHYKQGLKRVGHLPGLRSLISPLSFAGFGTPRIPYLYAGFNFPWEAKHRAFARLGSDVISCVSWTGPPTLYLADADLTQKINGNQASYPKPVEEYTVLNYFGPNLVTATGRDWRRQQVISKDVFNTRGWFFLWNETHNIFRGMMDANRWDDLAVGTEVPIAHAVDITLRVALLAIANAGFGMQMKWQDDVESKLTSGHKMSFQSALHIVAQSSLLKMALPRLAYYLPLKRIRSMKAAFSELETYIQEMIKSKKEYLLTNTSEDQSSLEPGEERADLFHNLVKASLQGESPLTDEELQGNIYIYLLAGHETTAHSIAFTFALLALWPEKQEALYRHILEIMPRDGNTTYDYYAKFDYVRAVYFETLRMFPPVQQIPKKLAKDTVFVFDKTNGQSATPAFGSEISNDRPSGLPALKPQSNHPDPRLYSETLLGDTTPSTSTSSISDTFSLPERSAPSPLTSISSSSSVDDESGDDVCEGPKPSRVKSDCKPVTDPSSKHMTATPEQQTLFVEKDTVVFISPPAIHYNPKYYPDPYEFKPERFVGKFDPSTFVPFSSGTRVCLGRHFSEVESVCFLAYMMREFSVHPVPAFVGETKNQMKERMFKAIPLITLTPLHIPLVFKKRESV